MSEDSTPKWERGFAPTVVKLRKDRGMTQKNLAHAGDLYQSRLSPIENGQRPSIDTIEKIATGLGLTVAQLMALAEATADELDSEEEEEPRCAA